MSFNKVNWARATVSSFFGSPSFLSLTILSFQPCQPHSLFPSSRSSIQVDRHQSLFIALQQAAMLSDHDKHRVVKVQLGGCINQMKFPIFRLDSMFMSHSKCKDVLQRLANLNCILKARKSGLRSPQACVNE